MSISIDYCILIYYNIDIHEKEVNNLNKYICSVCGYVYDEAKGIPEKGIAPGTSWDELPEDWVCPLCGATKAEFELQGGNKVNEEKKPQPKMEVSSDMKELTALELSVICSNLARGCEKQYKKEEAELFTEIADYFKASTLPVKDAQYDDLLRLVEKDLEEGLTVANSVAAAVNDRGAKRALVWNEKVTKILKSLLTMYQKEGKAMVENTGVYVCTICGFIYIGDKLPEVCPVCKVPNWKFDKIEGGN